MPPPASVIGLEEANITEGTRAVFLRDMSFTVAKEQAPCSWTCRWEPSAKIIGPTRVGRCYSGRGMHSAERLCGGPEVFLPALAARAAAQLQSALLPTLVSRPTLH